MTNKISYQKHLTQDDRIIIEKGLDTSRRISHIAAALGKDPSTISKEIRKHRVFQEHKKTGAAPTPCALAETCNRRQVCNTSITCRKRCRTCAKCHTFCQDYTPFDYHCPLTDRAPYVCNGCTMRSDCRLDKYFYLSTRAQREYRSVLVEARTGINISKEELDTLDATVSPLILKGQSPYMILKNHPEITLCEKTLYNYIENGALSVKNLDLPKKVKYKIRKSRKAELRDSDIFEGRTYKDYISFIQDYPDMKITEMDTVEGHEGSTKLLLTLHFCASDFMMAYIMDSKDARHVRTIFDRINCAITTALFFKSMPIIITDRGNEFRRPGELECSVDNRLRTSIYYCDPMAYWQKPHCERNHGYIRKICPQATTTFDRLVQRDVNIMMSHINSACRESLGGLTPFSLAKKMLPKELLDFFELEEIPPDEVVLNPSLLKGKIEII